MDRRVHTCTRTYMHARTHIQGTRITSMHTRIHAHARRHTNTHTLTVYRQPPLQVPSSARKNKRPPSSLSYTHMAAMAAAPHRRFAPRRGQQPLDLDVIVSRRRFDWSRSVLQSHETTNVDSLFTFGTSLRCAHIDQDVGSVEMERVQADVGSICTWG